MQFFVRAVVTGFALALGAALYKKVAKELGLEEPNRDDAARAAAATETGTASS